MAAIVAPGCASSGFAQEDSQPPNILLIYSDDVGREVLSSYGGESYSTPNLDKLAESGVRFETCYSTPLCAPSRVRLLTGRYNFRNYTRWRHLDQRELTFAEVLKGAGYATALSGKWQLDGWDQSPDGITQAGFDEYCSYRGLPVLQASQRGEGNCFWGGELVINGEKVDPDRHTTDIYADFLIDFMTREAERERPFLAYFATNLLHRPFMPTPDHPNAPAPGQPPPADWKRYRGDVEHFPAMVKAHDASVGRLLETLDLLGIRDNTIVIYTSDNGTDQKIEASDLRSRYRGRMVKGGKYYPSELGINVPLIISDPRASRRGWVSDALTDQTDILPTLADAAGVPLPEDYVIDGHSLLPIVSGNSDGQRDWIHSWGVYELSSNRYKRPAQHTDQLLHVVRDKRWKLYSNGDLYDLENDFFEESPISPGESPEADAARKRLEAALASLRESQPKRWW